MDVALLVFNQHELGLDRWSLSFHVQTPHSALSAHFAWHAWALITFRMVDSPRTGEPRYAELMCVSPFSLYDDYDFVVAVIDVCSFIKRLSTYRASCLS